MEVGGGGRMQLAFLLRSSTRRFGVSTIIEQTLQTGCNCVVFCLFVDPRSWTWFAALMYLYILFICFGEGTQHTIYFLA